MDAERLSGLGLALTLTLRDCPPTAGDWQGLRKRFLQRLRDDRSLRMIRAHWVTEWTRRKVPHLHLAVYVDAGIDSTDPNAETEGAQYWTRIVGHWLGAGASDFGADLPGQHCEVITGPVGWLAYMSKHAARGQKHYQRSGHPDAWTKTGRMWGHVGDWPTLEQLRFDIDTAGWYRLRRIVRNWRVAQARRDALHAAELAAHSSGEYREAALRRAKEARRRVVVCRHMLRSTERVRTSVRGVAEWLPQGDLLEVLVMLQSQGHRVEQIEAPGEDVGGVR